MTGTNRGRSRTGRVSVLILGASVTLAACGDLPSGGVTGGLEIVVVGDSILGVDPLLGLADLLPLDGGIASQTAPRVEGDITVWMQTYVRRGQRDWVEVTDGIQQINIEFPGGEAPIAVRPDFPAGEYTHVRNRFYKVEAQVVRGLTVDGNDITGTVTVFFGLVGRGDNARPIDLTVSEASTSTLAVELRASRWLRLLNRATRRVSPDDFFDALSVRRSLASGGG